MRIGAVLMLVVALLVAAGCSLQTASPPSPSPTAIPVAVSFSDPAALFRAVYSVGNPDLPGSGDPQHLPSPDNLPFAKRYGLPKAALWANLGVDVPGIAPTVTLAAVYPDAASQRRGVAFGQWYAGTQGLSRIPQLTGPNWTVWCIRPRILEEFRRAIGGKLSLAPAAPSPAPQ